MASTETFASVWTDLHIGKENPEQFRWQLRRFIERMGSIKGTLKTKFDRGIGFLLGDVLDGQGIHRRQAHEQHITDAIRQADIASALLAGVTEDHLLKMFNEWVWVCVPGNHGFSGRETAENASFDLSVYQRMGDKLRGKAIVDFKDAPEEEIRAATEIEWSKPMHVTGENLFLRKHNVRGHNFLLYHGHRMPKSQAGTQARVKSWATTNLAPFQAVLVGNYHQCELYPCNQIYVMRSGAWPLYDRYALNEMGAQSPNQTWVFGINDDRPITFLFQVDLN